MAGAGYKLFNTGDVLTAAQVNTYLMEQTVMVFADAAARTTALSGVVSEGMLSYLKSTKQVEVYNGSAWVASDDPNAIQNTIVDAKGDLITATAADTPARLAVGSNGDTLVADSAATTGLRWSGGTNLFNPVINSAFEVWQRGTSIAQTGAATYTADRWCSLRAGGTTGSTVSRQLTNDATNLPNIQYAARVQRDSGNTGTFKIFFANNFETANSIPFDGKTVTLSFYARAGANFSSASNALETKLIYGTGTDQNCLVAYTGETDVINQTATLTTTWQRFSYSASVPTAANELAIRFAYTPVGTAGANDWFEVTGVQIDVGSVALPFRTNGGTLQGELAACQRYFVKSYATNTAPGTASTTAGSIMAAPDATVSYKSFPNVFFPVTMRDSVTITIYNPSTGTAGLSTGIRDTSAGTNKALFVNNINVTGFQSYVDNSSTAAGNQLMFHYTASSEL